MRYCNTCSKWVASDELKDHIRTGHLIDWSKGYSKDTWLHRWKRKEIIKKGEQTFGISSDFQQVGAAYS